MKRRLLVLSVFAELCLTPLGSPQSCSVNTHPHGGVSLLQAQREYPSESMKYPFVGCSRRLPIRQTLQKGTVADIEACFEDCKAENFMYGGLGCNSRKTGYVQCFCVSLQQRLSPALQETGGGLCGRPSDKCDGPSRVGSYEVGGETTIAWYGLMPSKDYVVAPGGYEPIAIQRVQASGSSSPSLGDCEAPTGDKFSTLLREGPVTVPEGTTYIFDESAIINDTLTVEAFATLVFSDIVDLSLSVKSIVVHGTLQLGTEACPLRAGGVTITLVGAKPTIPDVYSKGIVVTAGGKIDMHGAPYAPTWTRLGETALMGDDTLNLQQVVNWEVGQKVVIVTTTHNDVDDNHQNEVRTITGVNGATISLDKPLQFMHFGGEEYQGEVALLSRSITVQGDTHSEKDAFGGHTLCFRGATCRLSYVRGYRMGQKNTMGRYPFHFHKMGDVEQKSWFRGLAVEHSYFRAFTIHGTSSATLSRSVAYDITGSAVYLEDGIEENNIIEFNLIARVNIIKPLPQPYTDYDDIDAGKPPNKTWIMSEADRIVPTDLTPACFYCLNPNNRWIGNVASGGFSGFIFPAVPNALGESRDANKGYVPMHKKLLEFDGNTVHSSGTYWFAGGCMYIGGILLTPDPSNKHAYEYSFAQFTRRLKHQKYNQQIFRDVMHLTNTKFYACNNALLAWGAKLSLRPFVTVDRAEFHDFKVGMQFFSHNWASNLVFTAHTGNTQAFRSYTPSTAFRTYDMFMQTVFANLTIRGYKGPGDVGLLSLVRNKFAHTEGFIGISGFKHHDSPVDNRVQSQRGGYCERIANGREKTGSGSATEYINLQDLDGTLSDTPNGAILGAADCPVSNENHKTKEWWLLDDAAICKHVYTASPTAAFVIEDDGGNSGYWACPTQSPNPWATQRRSVVQVVPTPRAEGVVYQFGTDRVSELLINRDNKGKVQRGNYGITGVCCDIGWYLDFDEGNPRKLRLGLPQMVAAGGLTFATRYPDGATFQIRRCLPRPNARRGSVVCATVRQAMDKDEFLQDKEGLQFFVDGSGRLFLHLVDPGEKSFGVGQTQILETGRDVYYEVTSSKGGRVEKLVPVRDWLASR